MQTLKNSGYSETFRHEILMSGLNGYNKILEADRLGDKPLYRSKEWRKSSRWMESKRKAKNWLGSNYKSCIFVPPTPGSELQKRMQKTELEMRPGGREKWPIRIIETAGKSLEKVLVKSDPLNGNTCSDKSCLPNKNKSNKIGCRRNNVGYRIPCKLCVEEGRARGGVYIGETGENMHIRMKSHLTKYNSKKAEIRESSAFYKHMENAHGGVKEGKAFEELFDVEIVKAYSKPMTRQTEEGTFMINVEGELLNSKTEWHQPKLIRTTIHTGGAEMAGGRVQSFPLDGAARPQRAGARTPSSPVNGQSGVIPATQQPVQGPRRSSRISRNGGR